MTNGSPFADGKWVDDDYYEDRSREEVLAKGLKPGDPVGELPDPMQLPLEGASNRTNPNNLAPSTNFFASGSSMVYKPGGPSTHFGGPGLGPFSGETAGSKRAALARDGVIEENWMWRAALGVREANEAIKSIRTSRLVPVPAPQGDVFDDSLSKGTQQLSLAPKMNDDAIDIDVSSARPGGDDSPEGRRYGVYEPHTNMWHCAYVYTSQCPMLTLVSLDRSDTQPTRYRYEQVDDNDRFVLGGTQVGTGAWGVLWVDTIMEFNDSQNAGAAPVEPSETS
jgi:chromatin structure-remodeling complex protein RSC7